jgi:hypothetical protein
MHVPGAMAGPIPEWEDGDEHEGYSSPSLSATAEHDEVEHDEVELGPLDEPTIAGDDDDDAEIGGATRTMSLDEVQWDDVDDVTDAEERPGKPADEA